MKLVIAGRLRSVLRSLPDVYTLSPETDYQAVVSHSATELAAQAWARTGKQMQRAIKTFETNNPNVKRKFTAAV